MEPRADRPHVVIIGGYLTEPAFYGPLRGRLLVRGAERVTIAPLHLHDWLGAAVLGFGRAVSKAAGTVREARQASSHPLLVVGHSAGGIVARLAMSPVALDGRTPGVAAGDGRSATGIAEDVGCLVTLGTPHTLVQQLPWWEHHGLRATRFLERNAPGALHAPRTGYLTVGSTRVRPTPVRPRGPFQRFLGRIFRTVVGPNDELGSDGIVSDRHSRLEGAGHVSLDDVLHGVFGPPWYGNEEIIDRWWPAAVERWREALAVRSGTSVGAGTSAEEREKRLAAG